MTLQSAYKILNKDQKKIVKSNDLRLLVLAGAGTGKTSSITVRIARHLTNDRMNPEDVVALTFSNKAAKELKNRVENIVGVERINGMFIGTFHAFCVRILANFHFEAKLPENFQILDTDDQKSLLRTIIKEDEIRHIERIKSQGGSKESIDDLKQEFKTHVSMIKNVIKEISDRKNNELGLDRMELEFDKYNVPLSYASFYAELVYKYESRKHSMGTVDFDDLILKTNELLTEFKWIKDAFNSRLQAILVDEYQDTSKVQSSLISLLCGEKTYLTVIGDDDQSIYGWRGAYIENILGFADREKAKTIKLEQNYRSTQNILTAANKVISNNENRLGKNLWTPREGGDLITVSRFFNNFDEGDYVAGKVKRLLSNGVSPSQIAVLYRKNFMSSTIEGCFHKARISYQVYGGLSFWQRTEIKDFLSLLKWVRNPEQALSIKRYLTLLKIGFGESKHISISQEAKKNGTTYETELSKFALSGKQNKTKLAISSVLNCINTARDIYMSDGLYRLCTYISSACPIADHYKKSKDEDKIYEMMLNIEAVCDMAKNFIAETNANETTINDDLTAFLVSADLQLEGVEKHDDSELVNIMTIHASKGLEFEYVFIIGADEGHFPSDKLDGIEDMEEERRIAYVAITRAKKELWALSAQNRLGKPTIGESRFISEIPEKLIKRETNRRKLF